MWATKSSNVTFPVCAAVASPVPRATAVSHTVPLVLRAFHLLVSILASPTFLPQLSQDFTGPSALLFPFQSQVPQPCRKEIISTNDFLGGLLSKGLLTASYESREKMPVSEVALWKQRPSKVSRE